MASHAMNSLEGDMLAVDGDAQAVNGDSKLGGERAANVAANDHPEPTGVLKEPFSIDVLVAGGDFGGVWYWTRYPGARTDSEIPFYQLNIPEVYHTWNFTERFPDLHELRRYIAHIDAVLDLRKDVVFNAEVCDARFDVETGRWTVKTRAGHTVDCKYLILASGLLHRRYTPDFPGLKAYKGALHHSGSWPQGLSVKGKKVGLIGTGATGVQLTQELGKEADELTVFVRRPSYIVPMQQRAWSVAEQNSWRTYYPALFSAGRLSLGGFPTTSQACGVFEVSAEEREVVFEALWARGGSHFIICNFNDYLLNKDANRVVYDFWRRKTWERLTDPKKQAVMAPTEQPFFFGTRRVPLENDYYEVLNRPNVKIVDLNKTPVKQFEEKGMRMSDDHLREFDVIIFATGFDSFSGSMTNMGLKNKDGVDLRELWKDGMWTNLGLTVSGFPNMFMSYTSQSPAAFSNGITLLEAQIDVIVDMIGKLEKEGAESIEPLHSAEVEWKEALTAMNKQTLLPLTSSWWNTGNIPGKPEEHTAYLGGIGNYEAQCRATMDGWKGFEVVHVGA